MKLDSTEFRKYTVYSTETPIAEDIDLTNLAYEWLEIDEFEEADFYHRIDFLNDQLQEKELIISHQNLQINEYKEKIKDYEKYSIKFSNLNQENIEKDDEINSLTKEINKYKEKLNLFSFKFNLPEDYYGNEEFNE